MIRLVTVIGHGIQLLPHFINHYVKMVDEINIVIYNGYSKPDIQPEIEEIIKNYNTVKIVKVIRDESFNWERVTELYNEIKNTYPNDWWVVADIDEFHIYNIDLGLMVLRCENNGWDLIRGGFIDRVGEDGIFPEIKPDENIFSQFPNAGFFRYYMSDACPNKICVMKGYIELTPGQHYAKINGQTTWRWQGWNHPLIAPIDNYFVEVHHFKWDNTVIDRIKEIADKKSVRSYSIEYERMYYALKESQFKIDIKNEQYLFEYCLPRFKYGKINKLIRIITSI